MLEPAQSDLMGWLEQSASAGVWVVSLPDGALAVSNHLARFLAWPPGALLPQGVAGSCESALAFYAPPFRDRMAQVLQMCVDAATPFDEEVQVLTANGELRWARACGRALRDITGTVTCVQGVLHDLTEKKLAEQASNAVTLRLSSTLASLTEAFATLDWEGRFTYINPEGERLLQHKTSALAGQPVWQVLRGERQPAASETPPAGSLQALFHDVLRTGLTQEMEEFDARLGKWLAVRVHPFADGVAVYLRDVTHSRQSQEQLLLLQTSIAQLNDMVVITEAGPLNAPGPRIVFVNDAFERRTGYARGEVLGRSPRLLQGKRTQRAELDRVREALESRQPVRVELINYTKQGEPYWVELEIVPVDYFHRGLTHWVAVARDISERKAAEDEIEGLAFYDALTELPNRQMLMARLERVLATQSDATPTTTVLPTAPAPLRQFASTLSPEPPQFADTVPGSTDFAPTQPGPATPHQPPGRNRRKPTAPAAALTTSALMFIDLDHFKILNDTLGHATGDLLLQKVALRLASCVRLSDTVARLGGDEFVVMLENLGHDEDGNTAKEPDPDSAQHKARVVGEKIVASLSEPFDLAGHQHHCTCSVGITLFGTQPITLSDVLKQADLAMYQAKAAGRNGVCFFDPAMQSLAISNAALTSDMRRGLREGEFELFYQPQVGRDGRMFGVEALLRWKHPERGMVTPDDFIPQAEESGLIMPLGQWVLQTACEQLAAWGQRPETEKLSIAINVSMRQFRHPEFVEQVLSMIAQTGIRAHRLKLELTESLLATGLEITIAKMGMLKDAGVTLSIDDFGIGYSALSYLKYLPLDQLKIDRAFVKDVLTDPNDAAIARTIIGLAQSLGLGVVAEGVETEEQRA
ncbi:MAG: EAL domain-containing protein, partial [Polaromonas sp.]